MRAVDAVVLDDLGSVSFGAFSFSALSRTVLSFSGFFGRLGCLFGLCLFNLGGVVGSVIGGRLLEGERPAAAAALGFLVLLLAIGSLSVVPGGNMMAALAAGGFVGLTLLGAQALLYGVAPQCYPAEVRGTGVGLAVSVGRVGSIVGPLLAGALLASGMGPQQLLYTILPVAALFGLTTVLLILRRRASAAAAQLA